MVTVSGRRGEALSTSTGEQDINKKIHVQGLITLTAFNIYTNHVSS